MKGFGESLNNNMNMTDLVVQKVHYNVQNNGPSKMNTSINTEVL